MAATTGIMKILAAVEEEETVILTTEDRKGQEDSGWCFKVNFMVLMLVLTKY